MRLRILFLGVFGCLLMGCGEGPQGGRGLQGEQGPRGLPAPQNTKNYIQVFKPFVTAAQNEWFAVGATRDTLVLTDGVYYDARCMGDANLTTVAGRYIYNTPRTNGYICINPVLVSEIHSELFNLVLLHELGHAFGFDHTYDKRDIMYPTVEIGQGILTPLDHRQRLAKLSKTVKLCNH